METQLLIGDFYEVRHRLFTLKFRSRKLSEAVDYANKYKHRVADFLGPSKWRNQPDIEIYKAKYSQTGAVIERLTVGDIIA